MSKRFPFPIPNGWFQVEWSHELKAGDVKPLKYFGKDLVLFRGCLLYTSPSPRDDR